MASHDPLRLSCKVEVEDDFMNNEELFWKICEWINPNKEVCSQSITNNGQRKKGNCHSSFGSVTVEQCGEMDRLKCCINLPTVQERDSGKWKCKLHKCKDIENGGCSSESPDSCANDIIVNVTVCIYSVLRFSLKSLLFNYPEIVIITINNKL